VLRISFERSESRLTEKILNVNGKDNLLSDVSSRVRELRASFYEAVNTTQGFNLVENVPVYFALQQH
jgi:hypothetical protein